MNKIRLLYPAYPDRLLNLYKQVKFPEFPDITPPTRIS